MLAIETPLGADELLLRRFAGHAEVGRLFAFELDLLSENRSITFAEIVGRNVDVGLRMPDGSLRYLNGFITRFGQTSSMGSRYAVYHATVEPWLWFLTRTCDCRIFQNMTVPDIIRQVFADYGFSDHESRLDEGVYRTWEYCVQYRETAFNFVSRLMEQEGIYYYFAHERGKHTLVLCDSIGKHDVYPGYASIPYRGVAEARNTEEHISRWMVTADVQPGTYAHTDYNFKKPRARLLTQANVRPGHAREDYEVFDFPGEYGEKGEGDRYSRVRIEALHAEYETLVGQSNARGITPGYRFALTDYPRADQNREVLVVAADYEASAAEYESEGRASGGRASYGCRFRAIPASAQFRSARQTAKPVVQGLQTAVVVGPKGEELHTDKYGRVKVQFHWDRYATADERCSCWIRVAQLWAGRKWGAMFIPRIGQEVAVKFIEGDPDRPLITGRVYNAEAMPPYELPAHATQSTLKSLSSKGGGGFNEIRYEDKKGEEQVFVHAEKDKDERVKNDSREWIGHDRHMVVKHDQVEMVESNKHATVRGGWLSKVLGNEGETVKGDRVAKTDGDRHLTVKGDKLTQVDGEVDGKGLAEVHSEAGQNVSVKAGMDLHGKAGMNYAMDAGMGVHVKGGLTVVIEAGLQLTVKAGGSFIDIGPAGIAVSGSPLVLVNSGGAAGSGGGSSPTAPAAPSAPAVPKEPDVADDASPGQCDNT